MIKKNKYQHIRKKKKFSITANLHVKCSYKNTLISLTKNTGEVLKQYSTKSLKKTKFIKNTPYNVQLIIHKINKYIKLKKINKLNVYFSGKGIGRFNTLKNLNKKIKINFIFDKTIILFNGCKPKKKKRL